jgi:hypothetical protein
MIKTLFLLAAAAAAQTSGAYPPNVDGWHQEYLETTSAERKLALLKDIAGTPPASSREVQALFDLFSRFDDKTVRDAAMASVHRLTPQAKSLENAFLFYLGDSDPVSRIFGINGALALRSERAGNFSPEQLTLLSEKNAWWAHYEALSALAAWKGAEVLPLLKKQSEKAPAVAALIGAHMWKAAFPLIVEWSRSSSAGDKKRAHFALTADAAPGDLRQTREAMLELLRDASQDKDLRHQLALKVGLSSTEEEVAALLKKHAEAKGAEAKLFWAAAIFASRSPQAVPLLKQFAFEDPEPASRLGALGQLRETLPEAEYRAVLEEFARGEKDAQNKEEAERQLTGLKKGIKP